nr:RNA-dependent RNA polymerase [Botrytis cinerea ourmia like virus 18]
MVGGAQSKSCAAVVGKPSLGSPLCTCSFLESKIRRTICSGLRVIRTRFSIEISELPDLQLEQLDCYLLQLLGSPATLPFPLWRSRRTHSLHRLGKRDRWSLAHSCASIKRSLSLSPCKAHPPPSLMREFFNLATQPSPPTASAEYLSFARSETKKIFQTGWDSSIYSSFVQNHVPNDTCRYDGVKSTRYWSSKSNKREFDRACLTGRFPHHITTPKLRMSEVPTCGKVRKLGIPNHVFELLGPLHKTMYQHLTKKSWLLRGPPKSKMIKKVCAYDWQTSVDLVSATDGLMLDVAEVILSSSLSKSSTIPGEIKVLASDSLRAELKAKDIGKGEVTYGQMMGTYLSFPLLCIQSYIAARWACRGIDANIKVNGDDTLISSNEKEVLNRYPPGFQINKKKTMVNRNVAEINSTAFVRSRGGWNEVRHLRRGGYGGCVHSLQSFAGAAVRAGPQWVSAFVKSRIGKKKRILAEDLGLPVSNYAVYLRNRDLLISGKWKRVVKEETQLLDERLEKVSEEPSSDAQIALRHLLFNEGRVLRTDNKNNQHKKSKVRVVQVGDLGRLAIRSNFGTTLTFNSKETKEEAKKIWFQVDGYESIDEARLRKEEERKAQRWCVEEPEA